MARGIHRLGPGLVAKARPGMYCDGGGLYLKVDAGSGSRSWVFRFRDRGRDRHMGLGATHTVSLAEARERARECRQLRQRGIDPIALRNGERDQIKLETAKAVTFDDCANRYIAAHRAGWRNPKHVSQWQNTLATYVSPVLGSLPVQAVDTALVLKAIEPIWSLKPETASRVRGRMEAVLDWATVRGLRDGENPARWKGHLAKLLPSQSKVRKSKPHAALPYAQTGEFMAALRQRAAIAARALELTILTAARTGEVLGARWPEIDFAQRTWTVPADRMKAKREHRVPLSDAAIVLLEQMHDCRDDDDLIFPGGRHGKPLSNMALLMILRRMGRGDLTAHGFRSTFRTWTAERTNFSREVAEAALAHVVGNKVEAAYQRGDLFEKRRRLMQAWAEFCAAPARGASVVALRGAAS